MILGSLCRDGTNYMLHYECYIDHLLAELGQSNDSVSCPNPKCENQHALNVNKDDPKRGPINWLCIDFRGKAQEASSKWQEKTFKKVDGLKFCHTPDCYG
jgi:hypothetical protein